MAKTVEIPLYILAIQDDGYHVFLEISVNDTKVYMLLDTGASRTVFDLETLKKIHAGIEMEENEDKATGLGSNSVDNFMAVVDKLEIGSMKIKNFEVGVLDISHVNVSYSKIDIPPIAGVFGSDILMRFDAVINYKKKTLKLTK
jgi:predicted aspartyl protease